MRPKAASRDFPTEPVCAYLRSLARLWQEPAIARLRIAVNPRLVSTTARLRVSARLIEVNRRVVHLRPVALQEIICHEAAHAVIARRLRSSVRPHGREWAELVRAAGFVGRPSLIRCGERRASVANVVQFRHVCLVCHFSKRAKRRMPRWRCPECRQVGLDGLLRIERISAR